MLIAGCHHNNKTAKYPANAPVFTANDDPNSPESRAKMPTLSETTVQTPLIAPPTPALAVAQGSLPLLYVVGQAGSIRVVDNTDKTTLLSRSVAANTIIAVDANRGVLVGGEAITRDPLPADHNYSIYLDADTGPNVFERGTIRPSGPAPATLPSVQH